MSNVRLPIAALTFSAAAFAGLITHEYYTSEAIIPTKNDRWTYGFGSTFRDDGTPVKQGDKTDPVQAVRRSVAHIAKDEVGLKACVTAPVSQLELDLLMEFSYQYGVRRACSSSMVEAINQGDYVQACNAYVKYKFSGGFDCSIPGNKVCAGVWTRSIERQGKCLAAL